MKTIRVWFRARYVPILGATYDTQLGLWYRDESIQDAHGADIALRRFRTELETQGLVFLSGGNLWLVPYHNVLALQLLPEEE